MVFAGYFLITFAIAMVGFLLNDVRRFVQVRRQGAIAPAEVVGADTHYSAVSAKASRYPVVRFATTNGDVVTAKLRWGKLRNAVIGDRVEIRYLPEKPNVVSLSDSGYPFSMAFWALLGGAFIVYAGARMLS